MDTHIWDELDLLSAKLARAETAHQRALSVGDADDTREKPRLSCEPVAWSWWVGRYAPGPGRTAI